MNTSDQITAYFTNRSDAEAAMNALEQQGVPDTDMDLHDSTAENGSSRRDSRSFMDRIKDFFTGESADAYDGYESGALLTVYGVSVDVAPTLAQFNGQVQGASAYASDQSGLQSDADQKLLLKEERLEVDKRPVQQGEVRVGKVVTTEHQEVDVPVTHEEVYVERRPVTEGASGYDSDGIDEGGEVRIPVMHEEVSVDKREVVAEEIRVGKRQVRETQTVGADVRKERARVNTSGNVESAGVTDIDEDGDRPVR